MKIELGIGKEKGRLTPPLFLTLHTLSYRPDRRRRGNYLFNGKCYP